MFRDFLIDLLEFIIYKIKELATSRLFPVSVVFLIMFSMLVSRLFQLQIIEGEEAQAKYTQTTRKTVSLASTRGNIYDRNGKLLAKNRLVYAVTVTDEGDYSNGYQKNLMLMTLVNILNKHDEKMISDIPIIINSHGDFEYTVEGNSLLRFLRDMYGLPTTKDFTEEKPADTTAEEAFLYMKDRYGVGQYPPSVGGEYEISDEDALKIINVRYAMNLNRYQKYVSTVVAQDIRTETMQDILEHSTQMLGVDVEENYIREYTDSECFSHIIGYTGKASAEEIENLNAAGGSYENGDVIGKTGIESFNEMDLQGEKGERIMYVDNEGHIQSIESETEPKTGGDVYLTIDADLQVGVYHLIEQLLAGIILDKLDPGDVVIKPTMKSSQRKIGVKDVYFQLINNNILDIDHFSSEDASPAEKSIYQAYETELASVTTRMKDQLLREDPSPYKQLTEDMQAYMTYAYSAMQNKGLLIREVVDNTDESYIAYHTDETMSLQEFLLYALSMSWIDTTKLNLSEKYTSASETYEALVESILEVLESDSDFRKKIYEQLINNGKVTGCNICLALFDQGILEEDTSAYTSLQYGSASTAYQFIRSKIQNLEITPAQLALDPCSGAVTLLDSTTGEVVAMVSYPGYDNNRISDSGYYYKLSRDLSHPLYSSATQTRTAPGSTFKLVSTIAAMKEGILTENRKIDCEGVFEKQGLHLACTGTHGELTVVNAITRSCNSFFSEVGYELSLDSNGNYIEALGVNQIQKYAELIGLSAKTGVEVTESEPKVSDTAPIPSAIGQGTHDYTNVQLARYAMVMATSGDVYQLTLLDRVTDITGKTLKDYAPEKVSHAEVSQDIWDIIHTGMYNVVHDEHDSDFVQDLNIAGKTGTAEENKMRPNHAHFVGYAPSDSPQYAIASTIPNGFSSTYSCRLANAAMELVFGRTTLDTVLKNGAMKFSGSISDE